MAITPSTALLHSTDISSPLVFDSSDEDVLSMIVSHHEEMNPRMRNAQEDCHVVHAPGTWNAPDPGLAYIGVYDGHGGRDMAEYLEYFMAYHVAAELKNNDGALMEQRLERAFLIADIHSTQCGVSTSGATVIVCLLKKIPGTNQVRIHTANAGDARAVLGHGGCATRLSHDHRVDDLDEVDRIDRAGGFVFKSRVYGILAVTRSLGDHYFKKLVIAKPYYSEMTINLPETTAVESQTNSFVIVACDGLWDVVDDQEAVDLALKFSGDKSYVAQYLVDVAMERGSGDNLTVIVAWLSG